MARWSEEQWKAFKLKVTLVVVVVVVSLVTAGVGPGLERMFLKPALARKTEPWAAKQVMWVALIEEHTFRRPRAQELYETDFYFNWRGDESQLAGLKSLIEADYAQQDEPEQYRHFLWWKAAQGRDVAWVGGEGAKPHPLFARTMLYLARCYEDDRAYVNMRHLHQALRACFEAGELSGAAERADLEEAIIRDKVRPV